MPKITKSDAKLLANVNSCSCSLYVVVRPSVCRLSSVCLSVTFVHPTQPIEIFGNVYAPFNTLVTWRHPDKILRRSSQGNPSVAGVKPKRKRQIYRFRTFARLYLGNGGGKLLLMTNMKSHMSFRFRFDYQIRWPWMTLNGVIALTAA